MTQLTPLERVFEIVGNPSRLAKALGITPWAVSKWDINCPPKDRCLEIEEITKGQVTAEELRPDINWAYVRRQSQQPEPA